MSAKPRILAESAARPAPRSSAGRERCAGPALSPGPSPAGGRGVASAEAPCDDYARVMSPAFEAQAPSGHSVKACSTCIASTGASLATSQAREVARRKARAPLRPPLPFMGEGWGEGGRLTGIVRQFRENTAGPVSASSGALLATSRAREVARRKARAPLRPPLPFMGEGWGEGGRLTGIVRLFRENTAGPVSASAGARLATSRAREVARRKARAPLQPPPPFMGEGGRLTGIVRLFRDNTAGPVSASAGARLATSRAREVARRKARAPLQPPPPFMGEGGRLTGIVRPFRESTQHLYRHRPARASPPRERERSRTATGRTPLQGLLPFVGESRLMPPWPALARPGPSAGAPPGCAGAPAGGR